MNAWWFFGLTLLIEMPAAVLAWRGKWKTVLLPCLLLNLFTWPLLHYLLYSTDIPLHWMELGVAVTESAGYRLLMNSSWSFSLLAGFGINGLSYGAGIIIHHYLI